MVGRLKAISVPMTLNETGYPAPAFGDKVLHDSIRTILLTAPGERVMRPNFGCDIKLILFGNINRASAARAEFEVRRAIEEWEPRVEVLGVELTLVEAQGQILIHVSWRAQNRESRSTIALNGVLSGAA